MNNDINKLLDTFKFRYACKKFDATKKISVENFTAILQAGRLSPSSFGFEPWKFLIIKDSQLKEELFPLAWGAQNTLPNASHFVIILARKKADTIYSSDYITHMMRDIHNMPADISENMRAAFASFQKNDFNLLESDRAIFDWASKQTYIALANMMTAAAYLGIDSCPIEGFNRKAVDELLTRKNIIDPTHFGVSVMASFGYRGEAPHREKSRQALKDIVEVH